MPALSSILLRLYPRAWRRRYGSEMQALLAKGDLSLRTVADVVAGAIDARFNPQMMTMNRTAVTDGDQTMTRAFRCSVAGASKSEQWRSAAWMAGGSLVLTLIGILVQIQVGKNSFSEGMLYAAFPASLMLSSECTYLKRYSSRARIVMSVGGALVVVLMMWGAVAIARMI